MPKQSPAAPRPALVHELRVRLTNLASNLWWTWNGPAQALFASLDPPLWDALHHSPIALLRRLDDQALAAPARDPSFLARLAACEADLHAYLTSRTWFARTFRGDDRRLCVAYFCAEFALHESLPLYAGGLGVLAGDHVKSASDLGVPLVGVGLLYRNGYYVQRFAADGSTHVDYPTHDWSDWPLADTGHLVSVPIGRRLLRAKVWKLSVGRVPLLLLDADIPQNRPADRALTHQLYGGDEHTRIQQELLLGVGGVRAVRSLGITPSVYHLNEGHAAFCGLERLREFRDAGVSPLDAIVRVRASTAFTSHTPVPAGHDRFSPGLMRRYVAPLALEALGKLDSALALGREQPTDRGAPFCMTVLALSLAGRANGVSRIHGRVSREMWRHLPDVAGAIQPTRIEHVTNGVHPQTWLAPEALALYERYLKPRWVGAAPDDDWWANAHRIPPVEFWALRNVLRRRLVHFVRQRLGEQLGRRRAPAADLAAALEALDEDALTVGFARRFATYKRATLIFRDPRRLERILCDARRPVQFIFAGKAHPRDLAGQDFARRVVAQAASRRFRGRVVVLENYDMEVGRMLTSGCDVWLNNPTPPQEASGTSGMKPPLHGGLNCSILDGWWPEAFDGRNGWAIDRQHPASVRRAASGRGDVRSGSVAASRSDANDAAAIYELLENRIAPLFYARDRAGVPQRWVKMMVASMKSICCRFSSHRMLAEYVRQSYLPRPAP
ncbi:MAG: Glycogen phosphorylase [Phycisphaerae bacterium]|nr:Glycogen phosphorylase [Phycisphaerae bacterium]